MTDLRHDGGKEYNRYYCCSECGSDGGCLPTCSRANAAQDEQVVEVCLGCRRPTEGTRDCGCPAGVGYVRVVAAQPRKAPTLGDEQIAAIRKKLADYTYAGYAREDITALCDTVAALRAELELFKEYARATEYWNIEPHDAKERRAWIDQRLFPINIKEDK